MTTVTISVDGQPFFTAGPDLNVLSHVFFGTFGGNSATVAFLNADGSTTYEFAIDNVFATQPDTVHITATWDGVTTPLGQLNIPGIFQSLEPGAGYAIGELVYVNGNLIGEQLFVDTTGTFFPTFAFGPVTAPYTLTEEFIVSATYGFDQAVNVGGAILATPTATAPAMVPGPIIGTGIPGLVAVLLMVLAAYRRRRSC